MGYGNGIVDWSAGNSSYDALGDAIAYNRNLKSWKRALKETREALKRTQKNLMHESTLRIALRDAARTMRNNGEITEQEFQAKFMDRMQKYENYVAKYGYKTFFDKVCEIKDPYTTVL